MARRRDVKSLLVISLELVGYLVEGSQKAALIDTCCGAGDLKAYVAGLTQKPIYWLPILNVKIQKGTARCCHYIEIIIRACASPASSLIAFRAHRGGFDR